MSVVRLEPPLDWPPLIADVLGSVWGIACPDCRVAIGDAPSPLPLLAR